MQTATIAWERSLNLAWESFLEGSVPVGCVITDGAGAIVAEGRNRMASPAAGGFDGSAIAHAEMTALGVLPPGEYGDHTIWSTLEPCFMCTAAIVHSHLGTARFAAVDPLVAGAARLPRLNRWVEARWPERIGPEPGEVGELAGLLHVMWHIRRKPHGTVATVYREADPELVARAERGLALLDEPPAAWSAARRLLTGLA